MQNVYSTSLFDIMYAAIQRYAQPQAARPRPEKKRSYRLAEKAKTKAAAEAASKHVHFGGVTVVGYSAETKEKTKDGAAATTTRPTTRPTTSRQSSYAGRPTAGRQASTYSGRPVSTRQPSYATGRSSSGKRYMYKSQNGRDERFEVVVGK